MLGRAKVTTRLSRVTMNSASETRARVQPVRAGAGTVAVDGVEARVVDGDIGALLY
jgi:hypothetical protein